MIEVKSVTMRYPSDKRYKDYIMKPFKRDWLTALKNINLQIDKGENVAFLGENGAGKTTLLKLIGGLLYPSQGEVNINNKNTVKNNLEARKSVGFVLNEERSFYWRLTAIQNLEFFGNLDNLFGKLLKNKIDELIGLVGLEHAANRRFATYSSGMKQRLAIARGLISDPNILILDEPTRALDPIASEEIRELIINKVNSAFKKTILIATHRIDEAEALCQNICIMSKGEVKLYDSLNNVKDRFQNLNNCYRTVNKIVN